MSDIFFKNFNLPEPHIHLGVGSGTHAQQTGNVMIEYGLVTLHRPSNVDSRNVLVELCEHLVNISKKIPLIFPVPPRTLGKLEEFGITSLKCAENIHLTQPLGYNDFMNLVFNSRLIITDSGGVRLPLLWLLYWEVDLVDLQDF
jgi:UDP-N-acetylglucosamine 2-epimerase (non-hydrolysing)